jgi:hypothetical protein
MVRITKRGAGLAAALLAPLVLNACKFNDDDHSVQEMSYRISVTNLSNNQPLSPLAVVLHKAGYHAWTAGMSASDGLEQLAEGGDTSGLISEAMADSRVLKTATGSGLIMPGASDSVDVTTSESGDLQLSLAAMLVNTNDGFTGVSDADLAELQAGDSLRLNGMAWDAGTEANSETAATIPGPAGGGEGYNMARDDVDFVSVHAGVVTKDDGLATSALDESYRFIGPVSVISITRTK